MSRLAVIVTAYGPRGTAALRDIADAIRVQTRRPDEVWVMVEDCAPEPDDWDGIAGLRVVTVATPREPSGRYTVIPYSLKINEALDATSCDLIAYVTDDSLPYPEKYERMAAALDEHPEWGAVYCGQKRNGGEVSATDVVADAHCRVDHTQVMHRRTADRWPLDVGHMTIGDAEFWRSLHASLGPFYPVPAVLDSTTQTPEGITSTWR